MYVLGVLKGPFHKAENNYKTYQDRERNQTEKCKWQFGTV